MGTTWTDDEYASVAKALLYPSYLPSFVSIGTSYLVFTLTRKLSAALQQVPPFVKEDILQISSSIHSLERKISGIDESDPGLYDPTVVQVDRIKLDPSAGMTTRVSQVARLRSQLSSMLGVEVNPESPLSRDNAGGSIYASICLQLSGGVAMSTLLERLSPKVAAIRGRVHGMVGTHVFRVFLVTLSWSGGEPGRGYSSEQSRIELGCGRTSNGRIVAPAVMDATGPAARYKYLPEGLVEEGDLVVTEISDYLVEEYNLSTFGDLKTDESTFFEVQHDRRQDSTRLRRYQLVGQPQHDAQGCQWILHLRPIVTQSEAFAEAPL